MIKRTTIALALAGALLGAARADGLWETDFDKAAARARKEHKLLLLYFTGSDW